MNKRILVSLATIGAIAAIAVGGTIAYFSDTETSVGNTFTAGELDLTVDSKCMYNGKLCVPTAIPEKYVWEGTEEECFCNFGMKDLEAGDLFFSLGDIKPGDNGEDTISLHVESNDACGFVRITKQTDYDNSCNEPEKVAEPGCEADNIGELDDNTQFSIWADICNTGDAVVGDNIYQAGCDIPLTQGTLNGDKYWGIGKLLGGQTSYFGISWEVPTTVGNEAQSDSFSADVQFTIEQYRNQYGPGTENPNGCPMGDITEG